MRCLATASITFSGLDLPADRPFKPLIKELFREAIGIHTCDRRSSKSIIHENYPDWPFEEGFEEEDPLWSLTLRETNEAQDQRAHKVLNDVFSTNQNTYISISSHSGQITAALRGKFSLSSDRCMKDKLTDQFCFSTWTQTIWPGNRTNHSSPRENREGFRRPPSCKAGTMARREDLLKASRISRMSLRTILATYRD
jgi:hypothetical protein